MDQVEVPSTQPIEEVAATEEAKEESKEMPAEVKVDEQKEKDGKEEPKVLGAQENPEVAAVAAEAPA